MISRLKAKLAFVRSPGDPEGRFLRNVPCPAVWSRWASHAPPPPPSSTTCTTTKSANSPACEKASSLTPSASNLVAKPFRTGNRRPSTPRPRNPSSRANNNGLPLRRHPRARASNSAFVSNIYYAHLHSVALPPTTQRSFCAARFLSHCRWRLLLQNVSALCSPRSVSHG